MDINETLLQIRAATATLRSLSATRREQEDAQDRLTQGFEALDECLSQGGFLPEAWDGAQARESREW